MGKQQKDPYKSYTINDWKWEFLRRNPRYKRAYRATEWLKRRQNGRFIGFGRVVRHLDLLASLQQQLGINPELTCKQGSTSEWSLPSPDTPASDFEYSPITGSVSLSDYGDFAWDEEPPVIDYPARHEVVVHIDTRFSLKEIVADLKAQLRPYQTTQRNQVKRYRDYLAVWDLRQQGITADEITPKLWPTEDEEKGWRDPTTGEKGPLVQRAYDHEKAAQKLIEDSFPPRKRSPKFKK